MVDIPLMTKHTFLKELGERLPDDICLSDEDLVYLLSQVKTASAKNQGSEKKATKDDKIMTWLGQQMKASKKARTVSAVEPKVITIQNKFSDKSESFVIEVPDAFQHGATVDEQRPLIPVEYHIGKLKPFVRQAILDSGAGPQTVQLDEEQLKALAKDKSVKRQDATLVSATGEEKREKVDGSLRIKGMKNLFYSSEPWIFADKNRSLLGRSFTNHVTTIMVGPNSPAIPTDMQRGGVYFLGMQHENEPDETPDDDQE